MANCGGTVDAPSSPSTCGWSGTAAIVTSSFWNSSSGVPLRKRRMNTAHYITNE
jgi:hypothetical protein